MKVGYIDFNMGAITENEKEKRQLSAQLEKSWGSLSLVSFLNTRGIKDLIKDNVKTECLRESK